MRTPNGLYIDDPAWPLVQGLVAYWGVTSANGNAGGTSIVCADLANEPTYLFHTVKLLSGPCFGQENIITNDAAGTETVGKAFTNPAGAATQIVAGTLFCILSNSSVSGQTLINTETLLTMAAAMGLTTFTTRTAVATNANGVNWVDLLDMSVGLLKLEELHQITLTISVGWAGLCQLRVIDGAGNKIFPFAAQAEENTDFVSGVPWAWPHPIVVPLATGYKVQFRSTAAGDGVGNTCTLTELAVIQRG